MQQTSGRIESLDQFRGYTVAGMFLVNFVGSFAVVPAILKHHNTYCSYADTIMPQFFFAVGFAYRLTFGRRAAIQGSAAAYGHVVRRLLGLILVGLVLYTIDVPFRQWSTLERAGLWGAIKHPLKSEWFQTLVHIAVTSLWVLPVIAAGPWVRALFLVASGLLHLGLSAWFNFEWVYAPPPSIDGGPLGFLTWTIPLLVGSLACDAMVRFRRGGALAVVLFWGLVLSGAGYAMSCLSTLYDVTAEQAAAKDYSPRAASPVWPPLERAKDRPWRELLAEPPFVPPPPASLRTNYPPGVEPPTELRQLNYWMMSQKVGTLSYLYFASGFSLLVYGLFVVLSDMLPVKIGLFHTLGTNALAGYVLHFLVERAVKPFAPGDSPAWYAWSAFAVFFAITWLFIRHLEKNNIYLKM